MICTSQIFHPRHTAWALVVQPLAYTAADIPPLDPSTLYLPQRLATEGQSVSFLMSAQSSQPFVETHW